MLVLFLLLVAGFLIPIDNLFAQTPFEPFPQMSKIRVRIWYALVLALVLELLYIYWRFV